MCYTDHNWLALQKSVVHWLMFDIPEKRCDSGIQIQCGWVWHWIYTQVKLISVTPEYVLNVDVDLKWKAGNVIKKHKNNHIICSTKVCINLGRHEKKKKYLKKSSATGIFFKSINIKTYYRFSIMLRLYHNHHRYFVRTY